MKCVQSEKVETEIYSVTFKARLPSHVLETFDYASMGVTSWYSDTKITFICLTPFVVRSPYGLGQGLFILYLQCLYMKILSP